MVPLTSSSKVIRILPGPNTGDQVLVDENGRIWEKVEITNIRTGDKVATLKGGKLYEDTKY